MPEWELLPKEDEPPRREQPAPAVVPNRKKRIALAFAVAAVSDLLSVWLEIVPPFQWTVDVLTAVLLFLILGRQWLILPGLIAEAIPGLGVLPFWVLVVGSIAMWGKISNRRG